METFLKKQLGRAGTPTPERGEEKGPVSSTNATKGGGKGRGNLRAMNEVKLMQVHPPFSTVYLSMTSGDLVMPVTANTAVVVCCR